MNVKQLIEMLSQVDENMEVMIEGHDQGLTGTGVLGVKDVVLDSDWPKLLEGARKPLKSDAKIVKAFVLLY
jgi:hypothetical protein